MKCKCCGKPTPGTEVWNTTMHHTYILCEGCHWDPAIMFALCKHNGTREKYFAYVNAWHEDRQHEQREREVRTRATK